MLEGQLNLAIDSEQEHVMILGAQALHKLADICEEQRHRRQERKGTVCAVSISSVL